MLLYIAGPMRGHQLSNFPAFFAASLALKGIGHAVVNPAERDMAAGIDPSKEPEVQEFSLHQAFAFDFETIIRADAMVLLPGWETSEGVAAERVVAHYVGTRVFEYDPTRPDMMRALPSEGRPFITWSVPIAETCEKSSTPAASPGDTRGMEKTCDLYGLRITGWPDDDDPMLGTIEVLDMDEHREAAREDFAPRNAWLGLDYEHRVVLSYNDAARELLLEGLREFGKPVEVEEPGA